MQTLYIGGGVFDGWDLLPAGQGVLVENGTIKRVGPRGEFAGFAGETVDTSGATLLPGLIDCHVHLCFGAEADPGGEFAKLDAAAVVAKVRARAYDTLASGFTAVRDAGGAAGPEFAVRDALARAPAEGPTIQACGHIICKVAENGDHVGRIARSADEVAAAVQSEADSGADFINIMATGAVPSQRGNQPDTNYTAAEIAAGLAACHARALRSASNAQRPEDIHNVVANGVTSVELGTWMDDGAARAMVAAGTFLVPCLLARWQATNASRDPGKRRFFEQSRDAVRRFHEAGGRITVGTDCGAPNTPHGANAQELDLLTQAGLSPLDALRAATRNGAALMGLADAGTVSAGARADFLVVEGDPTRDIASAADPARHRFVVKDGVRVAKR